MKQYNVNILTALHTGAVRLTDEQVRRRIHTGAIEPTEDDGVFNIVGEVQFKKGEVIDYDGEVTKAMAGALSLVDDESDDDSGSISEKSTVAEIKAELGRLEISFDAKANKAELLKLLTGGE